MHRWLVRLATQLTRVVLEAFVKQTVYDVHNRDSHVAAKWLISLALGGLFYYTRTFINYGHNPEEFERRTNPAKVALASVNYLGAASFIPSSIDSLWAGLSEFTGEDLVPENDVIKPGEAIFGFGRTSGLAGDFFQGNPTIDLINKASRSVFAPIASAISEERSYSQKDLDNLRKTLPLGNAAGVARFFDWLGQDVMELPETPKE
jgi:hypothetical protein